MVIWTWGGTVYHGGSTWWGVIAHAMKFRKQKDREGRTRLSNNPSEVTPSITNSLSLGHHLLKFPAPPQAGDRDSEGHSRSSLQDQQLLST